MFIILAQFGFNPPTPDYDEIAAVLRGRGHQVWVATPNDNRELIIHDGTDIVATLKKPVAAAKNWQGVPGVKKLSNWFVEWIFAMRLRRFIRENKPDVIQMNRAKLTFFWLIPLWAQGTTRYVLDWRQISERVYKGLVGKVKRFIAVQYRRIPSRYIYDQACFLHGAGARQVLGEEWQKWATVVPLAVNAGFLQNNIRDVEPKEQEAAVRFIYIGTLSQVRRLDRILIAAQKIHMASNGDRDFKITFIGPDQAEGKYQEMINQLELSPIVNIEPPIPYQDVPETIANYDVALAIVPEYPLDWQYHPTLKVLEYRALGMPIIATDFEPNRQVVQDEVNGLLVCNSVDKIASAMQRFINDDEFLVQCAVNAQNMREALLWQDISEMYEKLYQQLLQT